jgi:hypothetical protein
MKPLMTPGREARFGQQGTLTRVWARTGSRPAAVRQTQYDYLWVLTAASPGSGQSIGLISPTLNAKVINLFLKQMSDELQPDVHAVLVWDGAGFHTAGDVAPRRRPSGPCASTTS